MSESSNAPFDPLAFAAAERAAARERFGPRLTLTEQCQALAVLKSGFAQKVVGQMFGLSPASVSHIANCTQRRPGRRWHYQDVFAEWRRLGENDFIRTYLSEEIALRAKRLKYDHIVPAEPLDNRLRGVNRNADSQSYDKKGDFELVPKLGGPYRARVDWIECDPTWTGDNRGPIGWRYGIIEADGTIYYSGRHREQGNEPDLPFATSGEAFDAAHDVFDLPSPRRKRT